jgi:hypothetical protein
MPRHWTVVALALGLSACSMLAAVPKPPPRYEVPPGPRGLDAASPQERMDYMSRAQVWQPVPTSSLDLLAGPPGPDAFAFQQPVECAFTPPKRRYGGSAKFSCALSPGDTVKVKYGETNREVYGEVAATRLFWALGFGTDRQYPVRVTCRDCPPDPFRRPRAEPGAVHTFTPAIIERDPPGNPITVKKAVDGWAWWELLRIDERKGGAPRAHVDALRLLAAFVQHTDNKDDQQMFACLPGGVQKDAAGNETCSRPFLYVVDLGATFSRADLLNRNKFELAQWSSVPVWKDRERCVAKLKRSNTGTIRNPKIGEAGRQFLADLLAQLSEKQVRDLFTAAQVERRGERIKDADGRERPVTVDDWVRVFARKRAEIKDHRCPS